MNLNNRFVEYLTEKIAPSRSATYLLAVSGGVDSMTMTHLFYTAGLSFGVAHCNFSLRGTESDLDQNLVQTYCHEHGIPFHGITFDTQYIATLQQLSIQETARNLRYEWFYKLQQQHGYDLIATAHHLDDNVETVLFNLVRGTGIKGLRGIPLHQQSIIRPLLFAPKNDLISYAHHHQIPYRNDASNLKDTYARNKIRNQVIPMLTEVNSEAVQHIHHFSEHSYAIASIVEQHMAELSKQLTTQQNGQLTIDCKPILNQSSILFYLYELLAPYAFNASQVNDIHHALKNTKSGKQFWSPDYAVTVNRTTLIVERKQQLPAPEIIITDAKKCTFSIGTQVYQTEPCSPHDVAAYEPGNLYMDCDLLSFPLSIRKWKHGDSFTPLGMNGRKKVSDYLIDKKVSLPDKEKTFVVSSRGTIIAILNHVIDDTVKVHSGSRCIFRITLQKKSGTD